MCARAVTAGEQARRKSRHSPTLRRLYDNHLTGTIRPSTARGRADGARAAEVAADPVCETGRSWRAGGKEGSTQSHLRYLDHNQLSGIVRLHLHWNDTNESHRRN